MAREPNSRSDQSRSDGQHPHTKQAFWRKNQQVLCVEHAAGPAGTDSVPQPEALGAAGPALSEDSTHSHIGLPQAKTRWPVTCDKVRRMLAEWRLGWGAPRSKK